MKESFSKKRWIKTHLAIIELANSILDEYAEQGFTMTLRQLYYQFIQRDWFPADWIDTEYNRKKGLPDDTKNTQKNYKSLGEIISDGRLCGFVDWDAITDGHRSLKGLRSWSDPSQIIQEAARNFRHETWSDQPHHIEVMIEKDALLGTIQGVCEELRVDYMANKGYSSSTHLYNAGNRIKEALESGKDCHIIYLGDHDPSGIDMSRDIQDRAELFSRSENIQVHRVALNMDQIKKLKPPTNPAKTTDSRSPSYIRKFGDKSWELDALSPKMIADLIRGKINEYRDVKLWDAAMEREETARVVLTKLAGEFRKLD